MRKTGVMDGSVVGLRPIENARSFMFNCNFDVRNIHNQESQCGGLHVNS